MELEEDDETHRQPPSESGDDAEIDEFMLPGSPGSFAGEAGSDPEAGGSQPASDADFLFESSSASDGMAIDDETDEGTDAQSGESEGGMQHASWHPGRDCGEWIRGRRALDVQAQVLIGNAYLNLRRLPSNLAHAVLDNLSPGNRVTRNFADRLSGLLLGLAVSTARTVYDRLSASRWRPVQPEPSEPPEAELQGAIAGGHELSEGTAMSLRVREILAICHSGRPDTDYTAAMRRLGLQGIQVGSKNVSRHFVEPVELLGATAAMAVAAARLHAVSPCLGIPSDLSIIWDGVSIGARNFSRYESLTLVGAVFMDWHRTAPGVSQELGGQCRASGVSQKPGPLTTSCFLVGPSAGQMHTGLEQVDLILGALAGHPAALTKAVLKTRLSAVGSDGAAANGGETSIHTSTKGSELIWKAVYPNATPVAEWDLFHRIDLGVTKAIAGSAAALEIFDVARVLGQLFGSGDGRVIFRASAAAVGAKHYRVPDQGGTRKVVALARTVQSLLRSLKTYQAALHARRGQGEGPNHRGSQTKQHLVSVGRRVTALNFVTFSVAIEDVLRSRVVPLALQSQAIGGASWEMDRKCEKTLRHLTADVDALTVLRRWVFASALLQQYMTRADLCRLWFTLVSAFRKRFPTLVANAFPLMFQQEFGGCQLNLVRERCLGSHHHLSPKCQCQSMRTRPSEQPRLAEVDWLPGAFAGDRRVRIRVPEWVAHSAYPASEWQKTGFLAPRFLLVPKEEVPPLGLAGIKGRFRQSGTAPCRCVVPAALVAATEDVLSAMSEALQFFDSLIYHLRAYAVGSVGVPGSTRTVLDLCRQCWDWRTLLTQVPKECHYRAFFALYEALLPTLRFTSWPSDATFDFLQHSWPSLRGANGAFQQYQVLMQRVRRAAKKREDWRSTRLLAEPVWSTPLAAALGRRLSAAGPSGVKCILHVIAGYLRVGTQSGIARVPAFEVCEADLARLGHGHTRRRARTLRRQREYKSGTFAPLVTPHFAGRLVRVRPLLGDPDEEIIAASLLTDKSFAAPDLAGTHCWHTLRVYMRSRMMRAPESGCERWGSLLHSLWDPVSGWEPHRMVSRLLTREAGFDGTSGDHEDIVQELAAALAGWMGKTAFTQRPRAIPGATCAKAENLAVRRGLREHQPAREAWKLEARPCNLLPGAEHAVKEAVRLGRHGALQALPVFAEDVRTTSKSRTASVAQDALAQFLQSDEGRQWREDRKALFGGGAACRPPAPLQQPAPAASSGSTAGSPAASSCGPFAPLQPSAPHYRLSAADYE